MDGWNLPGSPKGGPQSPQQVVTTVRGTEACKSLGEKVLEQCWLSPLCSSSIPECLHTPVYVCVQVCAHVWKLRCSGFVAGELSASRLL